MERGEDTAAKDRASRRRPWTAEGKWLNIGDHDGHGNHTLNVGDERLAEIIAEQHNRVLAESEPKGSRGLSRSLDEALNSGDGSYRP